MLLLSSLLLAASFAKAQLPDYITVERTGGETSARFPTLSSHAYQDPAANLSPEEFSHHLEGDVRFERKFVDDPNNPSYGLGPVYNNVSCVACHIGDGRGAYPLSSKNEWTQLDTVASVFLRMSVEGKNPPAKTAAENWGMPEAVPGFSTQLFHLGSFFLRPDSPGTGQAQVFFKFEKSTFIYPDGTTLGLRKPVFKIEKPYDEVPYFKTGRTTSRLFENDVHFSPRMTPPMVGLGLLEAIPEQDILALAKRDLSAWGVHGHPNFVYDVVKDQQGNPFPISLGRFGLKGSTPTVFQQSLGAFNGDMGVTSQAFPQESIFDTPLFDSFKSQMPNKGMEVSNEQAEAAVFYSSTLAVPNRRNIDDPQVIRGGQLFTTVGCVSCHEPKFVTGPHAIKPLVNQTIYPFTDMLLHDMGPGLADGRRDGEATGSEWKTRALWGLGHTQVVNPRAGFLHDGRAQTIEEAVIWHGGEAEKSKQAFAHLTKADRDALLAFLQSL